MMVVIPRIAYPGTITFLVRPPPAKSTANITERDTDVIYTTNLKGCLTLLSFVSNWKES